MEGAALSEMAKLGNGNMISTSDRYNSGGKSESGGGAAPAVGNKAGVFSKSLKSSNWYLIRCIYLSHLVIYTWGTIIYAC